MKNAIEVNSPEYLDACDIIHDPHIEELPEKIVKEARIIVREAEMLEESERRSQLTEPHYPDAPEGSIWDY